MKKLFTGLVLIILLLCLGCDSARLRRNYNLLLEEYTDRCETLCGDILRDPNCGGQSQ